MNIVDTTFQVTAQENCSSHDMLCCDLDQATTK